MGKLYFTFTVYLGFNSKSHCFTKTNNTSATVAVLLQQLQLPSVE